MSFSIYPALGRCPLTRTGGLLLVPAETTRLTLILRQPLRPLPPRLCHSPVRCDKDHSSVWTRPSIKNPTRINLVVVYDLILLSWQ